MEQSNPESADQIIDFLSSRMGELVDGARRKLYRPLPAITRFLPLAGIA